MLQASFVVLDHVSSILAERDRVLHVLPAAMFLPFAARSQLLKQTASEQLAWINAANALTTRVLAGRAHASRYGKGRRCALPTTEMAQAACELAKQAIDETRLTVDRKAAQQSMLYRSLLEFACLTRILEPADLGTVMSACNEKIAEVLASGWLDRNVVKIRG